MDASGIVNQSELNPYRTPLPEDEVDGAGRDAALARTKFRRIISTVICTGAAFWCLFPAVAFLDRIIPSGQDNPDRIPVSILLLLTLIGVTAFVLGLCIRHNQQRYLFSLFMALLTMIVVFMLA